jgi:phosphatidate phosphatase APP1
MAEIYRRWSDLGGAFHYVSSCPWQLYRQVSDHLTEVGFPAGSYHLRSFRLRDHLIRRLLLFKRSGKKGIIYRILKMFPLRKFILVGDSGEHDPEIYGAAARRFPGQIQKIFIRNLHQADEPADRYERAFRQLPTTMFQLFDDPAELSSGVKPLVIQPQTAFGQTVSAY